eukprot:1149594-Prorocentrum_minimum.AAC.1
MALRLTMDHKKQQAALMSELEGEQEQRDLLMSELADMETKQAAIAAREGTKASELASLGNLLQRLKALKQEECAGLGARIEDLESQVASQVANAGLLAGNLASVQRERDLSASQLAELEIRLAERESRLAASEESRQAEVSASRLRASEFRELREAKQLECAALTAKMEELQNTADVALQTVTAELRGVQRRAEEESRKATAQHSAAAAELSLLGEHLERTEQQRGTLERQVAELESRQVLATATTSLQLEASGSALEELKALKQAEHDALIAKIAQLEAQVRAEAASAESDSTTSVGMSQELEALSLELEAVGAELKELKELKQAEHDTLTAKVARLESQAEAEVASAESVENALNAKLEEQRRLADESLHKATSELSQAQQQAAGL